MVDGESAYIRVTHCFGIQASYVCVLFQTVSSKKTCKKFPREIKPISLTTLWSFDMFSKRGDLSSMIAKPSSPCKQIPSYACV